MPGRHRATTEAATASEQAGKAAQEIAQVKDRNAAQAVLRRTGQPGYPERRDIGVPLLGLWIRKGEVRARITRRKLIQDVWLDNPVIRSGDIS